ncbi:putative flavoprotein YhiN [Puniceicoccus vermicola]|uniref:NAD(P)/FAD-dependent oxidoreductase n=1 Tax=Puniceicoccus vermicola TaxID=388746 RepID=A0A7X1E675_9BACT|nr:NAD(P)/FAD-dependent oxidoreductase [Puniceicoccus vermicola]
MGGRENRTQEQRGRTRWDQSQAFLVGHPNRRRLQEKLAEAAGLDLQTQWSQAPRAAVQTSPRNSRRPLLHHRKDHHFAGECIDYDGITGGFNFQGAWTTVRIAGLAMSE